MDDTFFFQVFKIRKSAHCCNVFADELSAILSEDVRRDAARDEAIVNEEIQKVHGCCTGR